MLHHPYILGGHQQRGQIKVGPKEGGIATSPLHSRGSPTKEDNIRIGYVNRAFSGAQKRAEMPDHPYILGGHQQRGQNQSGPKRGRQCYITPAFPGVPNKGDKSKRAQKRAEMLHHPCILGGPQQRRTTSELATSTLPSRGPKRGRKCYITPTFSGVPNKGDKIKAGPKEGGNATSPLHSRGSPTKGTNQSGPKRGRKCYITPTFSGVPNKGDKIQAGPKEGGNATSPLHSRGSPTKGTNQSGPKRGRKCYITPTFSGVPNKGDKIKAGPKEGGNATSPLHSRGSPTKGTNQSGPKRGRKCYITPAFSAVTNKGGKIKAGPKEGGNATSHLHSRRSPTKGTKSKRAQKRAEMLHHPCILGGPQQRGQIKAGPKEGGNATSPLHSRRSPTKGTNQSRPKRGRKCYITPAFSGVPNKGDKIKAGPKEGGNATPPLHSPGSPTKGTKSKRAQKRAEMLHHPCILGGPQQREQIKAGPKEGGNATSPLHSRGSPTKGTKSKRAQKRAEMLHHPYILGGPQQRGQIKAGPKEGGNATSPLHSRRSPTKGAKSKRAQKRAEMLHHPCILGGPQQRGQIKAGPKEGRNATSPLHSRRSPTKGTNQSGPKRGRKCCITPAFSAVTNKGDKIKAGPKEGGNATSPLHSRGSPTKGTNQSRPKRGRKCYITPAFSAVTNKGGEIKAGPKEGGNATSPLHSRGSPTKGTNQSGPKRGRKCYITPAFSAVTNKGDKSKQAQKRAEMLHHPCILGGPQQRGQNQSRPKRGQKCYITPTFSGVPNKGDKSKRAQKRAEMLHHPCILGGHQQRGQNQSGPKRGRKCYITPAFSAVPNKGDKSKRAQKRAEVLHHPCILGGPQQRGQNQSGPKRGRKCYITPAFSGVPNKRDKSKRAQKRAEMLHHPCILGGHQQRGQNQSGPKRGRKCYITPAFSGVPNKGDKSKQAQKRAEMLHHPCILGGPQQRGQNQSGPKRGRKCYITPTFPGVPNKGDKSKQAQKRAELLHHPCILGGPQQRRTKSELAASILPSGGTKRGRKCYITPAFSGVTNKGDKSKQAQKRAKLLHHPCILGGPQTRGNKIRIGCLNPTFWGAKSGRKCYITPTFSGVPNKGDKIKAGPKEGGNATSPLHSRRSPTKGTNQSGPKRGRKCYITPAFSAVTNKGDKSKQAQKRAEMLHHTCILGGPQQRGQNQSGPKRGRKCYTTPAFSGVPNKGDKIKAGPKESGNATSPLHSRRSPTKGTNQSGPKRGRKCYITPSFSGVPNKGDKIKAGPKEGGNATSPLHSRGSPTKGTNQSGPKRGRKCYITPAFSAVTNKGGKIKAGPKEGGNATSPLHSRRSPTKGTNQSRPKRGRKCYITPTFSGVPNKGDKSKRAQKRAEMLHHPCILGGHQQRGQNQSGPKRGRKCYITPAFSGVPNKGDKSKRAPKRAEMLHHPCILGGHQQRGQIKAGPKEGGNATSPLHSRGSPTKGTNQSGPKRGRKCYITPAFSAVTNKGDKSKQAQKRAEMLHHPCILGGPQQRGQNQSGPKRGRKCYITPTFPGVPNKGDKIKQAQKRAELLHHPCILGGPQQRGQIKAGPKEGGNATSPLHSRGSPTKGAKSKRAEKRAEMLHHPYIPGGPQQRGQIKAGPKEGGIATSPLHSRGSPTKEDKIRIGCLNPTFWGDQKRAEMLHHPCILGGHQQRGQIKAGPKEGEIATSPLHSRGSPNTGEQNQNWLPQSYLLGGQKRAEMLHHPSILRGPQQGRTTSELATSILPSRGPKRGRKCYITPTFSGVPNKGDKIKAGPKEGGNATSPLHSRRSPTKGTNQSGPKRGRKCYITPAVSEVPHKGGQIKAGPKEGGNATSPLHSRGSPTKGTNQSRPKRGRNCYITPAFSGVPNKGGQNQNWLPQSYLLGGPKEGGNATSPLHSWGSPTKGTNQSRPKRRRNCYITAAFSGVPKHRGTKSELAASILPSGGPKAGRNATSPLHSRGSPTREDNIRIGYLNLAFSGAQKRAEMLRHPYILGGHQQRGQIKAGPKEGGNATSPLHSRGPPTNGADQSGPKRGRKCYITPAFSGVTNKGGKIKAGPKEGRNATSPLHSRRSPTKGTNQSGPKRGRKCYITPAFSAVTNKGDKSKQAQKRAEMLHHTCILGGPQQRGQNQSGPKRGRKCYITPTFSGVPNKGDKSKRAQKRAEMLHHPCSLGVPNKGGQIKAGPKEGGNATSPLHSRGSPTKGTNQSRPKRGRNCYITPAFSGVPNKGGQNQNWLPQSYLLGGPKEGGNATSPLHSRGSPTKGTNQSRPKRRRNCYISPAFSGVPKHRGTKSELAASILPSGGPKAGGNATSPLHSRGSPTKEDNIRIGYLNLAFSGAQKRAEMLHHPCILGGPQQRGQNQSGPKRGRKCYVTPAFSAVPNKKDKSKRAKKRAEMLHHPYILGGPQQRGQIKAGPKEGGNATSPLHSRRSPTKGAKSKRAQKRAEMLHHPCILGGPQQRGQNQSGPKRGRKCYITPAFSAVTNKGDKSKQAQKRAEMLHHPCILGGHQQRGQNQSGPKRGRKCYITPTFSGVPNKGDKIKTGPKEGGNATSPLHSRGSPTKGTNQSRPKRGRKCYITPAFSGIPKHRATKSELAASFLPSGGTKRGQKCYITPAFSGVTNKGDKSKQAQKTAKLLHHPCILGGLQTQGNKIRIGCLNPTLWGAKSGRKCYITPPFSGVPNKGGQHQNWLRQPCLLGGPKEGGNATSPLHSRRSPTKGTKSKRAQKRAEMLHHPCILGGPQQRGQIKAGPKEGGNATSPLQSRGSPTKGTNQSGPKRGRKCYITPAFSAVTNKGDKSKQAQKRAEMLHHPCILGDPQTQGDKIRIGCLNLTFWGGQKQAEMLHHPCILGGPQQRGQINAPKKTQKTLKKFLLCP